MEILSFKNFTFSYSESNRIVLENINLTVNEGEILLLYGKSGCGKTTLLSLINEKIAPKGTFNGELRRNFKPEETAFLFQNPEMQLVTDKVWHEIAFACENRGWSQNKIRHRVSETAEYFGLSSIFRRETHSLSGGQKQLVNLAAACVTNPKLLILDEPASALDPLSAERLMNILKKMNKDFGTTIVISEHNSENIFADASRAAFMEDGRITYVGSPKDFAAMLKNNPMLGGLPCSVRIGVKIGDSIPLTNKEARSLIEKYKGRAKRERANPENKTVAAQLKNVGFQYERDGAKVLHGVNLKIHQGEILSVIGENGGGKSTLLHIMSGLLLPREGSVRYFGKPLKHYKSGLYRENIALLPQNPTDCFTKETLFEDWKQMSEVTGYGDFTDLIEKMGLENCMNSHPYDLSGGEQQRGALGMILMQRPKLLLLDEPCKGLDWVNKEKFKSIIRERAKNGTAIVIVTHDLEIAAELSHSCAFLFDGEIVSQDDPHKLFSENVYYTTPAVKISREILDGCITAEEVVLWCKGEGNEK